GRPRGPGQHRRGVRPAGALRGGHPGSAAGLRCPAAAGQRGERRQSGAEQGRRRRSRRRPGLHDRCASRRRRGRGDRTAARRPGDQLLPGRRAAGRRGTGTGPPVRGLPARPGRPRSARRARVRSAMSRGRRAHRSTSRIPALLWLPATCALLLIVLPVAGLLTRTDPRQLPELLLSPAALEALRLSIRTALIATALSLLLGGPLALVLARSRLPGVRVLRALVLLPLVLPPVVGGLALLYLLGRTGPVGQLLALVGVQLPYTTTAVVLAQTFVAMPFLVVGLEGALRTAGERYEQVAATLGASPWLAF